MRAAALLVIEEKSDGVFLYRFSLDASFAGDTWHRSIDEAKEQAEFEYSDVLINWEEIPSDVQDVLAFGMARVRGESAS